MYCYGKLTCIFQMRRPTLPIYVEFGHCFQIFLTVSRQHFVSRFFAHIFIATMSVISSCFPSHNVNVQFFLDYSLMLLIRGGELSNTNTYQVGGFSFSHWSFHLVRLTINHCPSLRNGVAGFWHFSNIERRRYLWKTFLTSLKSASKFVEVKCSLI